VAHRCSFSTLSANRLALGGLCNGAVYALRPAYRLSCYAIPLNFDGLNQPIAPALFP